WGLVAIHFDDELGYQHSQEPDEDGSHGGQADGDLSQGAVAKLDADLTDHARVQQTLDLVNNIGAYGHEVSTAAAGLFEPAQRCDDVSAGSLKGGAGFAVAHVHPRAKEVHLAQVNTHGLPSLSAGDVSLAIIHARGRFGNILARRRAGAPKA